MLLAEIIMSDEATKKIFLTIDLSDIDIDDVKYPI